MIKKLRKSLFILWILSILGLGIWIHFHKELLDPNELLRFFQSFGSWALIAFILASFIRGLVLIPSLPLVFVGVLFFPHSPLLVFLISMLGIIFSGILIYRFSDFMGFDSLFENHTHSIKVKKAIETYGFYTVLLWSFAPIVPTDLICYVAGTVKMNFWKFILALSLGEGFIVGIIIYGGKEVMKIFGI
ncbi:TVP38/TMEM64 family protein [Candidatus Gracilibacteria bacterium]|nr:TVP38/TMEM64 family protein [Candidatus Gracilibacteria bacterium]